MKRAAAALVAEAALALALLAPAAGATPPPGWLVADRPTSIEAPQLVAGDGGRAAAIWMDVSPGGGESAIEGVTRAAGEWAAPTPLGEGIEPTLALGADGSALALWTHRGLTTPVRGALATPSGGWVPVAPIPGSISVRYLQVVADPDGRFTAVFHRRVEGGQIYAVTADPTRGWPQPIRLTRKVRGYSPQIAVAPSGRAVAVWRGQGPMHHPIVQASMRGPDGHWSLPRTLSPPAEAAMMPRIAIGAGGAAAIVWIRRVAAGERYVATSLSRSGRVAAPVAISPLVPNLGPPRIALAPDGEAVVAWGGNFSQTGPIEAAVRGADGTWSGPVSLRGEGGSGNEVAVEVGPSGLARAIWSVRSADATTIEEASRPAGGSWSAPRAVATEPGVVGWPAIAASPAGEVLAAWSWDRLAIGPLGDPPPP
jgi:hypothetical protein